MASDLNISKELNALIGSLFFLAYFAFQIPGALYAQNKSVRVLVFWSLILWGGCAVLTGVISDAHWLLAIRLLLGVVEAAVLPAMPYAVNVSSDGKWAVIGNVGLAELPNPDRLYADADTFTLIDVSRRPFRAVQHVTVPSCVHCAVTLQ